MEPFCSSDQQSGGGGFGGGGGGGKEVGWEERPRDYEEKGTYLRLLTFHTLQRAKDFVQRRRALLQTPLDALILLPVQLITLIPLLGRINLHLDETLSDHRRAEHDTDEFVNLRRDLLVEAHKLKVPTAVPAFADHTLGNAVEGG